MIPRTTLSPENHGLIIVSQSYSTKITTRAKVPQIHLPGPSSLSATFIRVEGEHWHPWVATLLPWVNSHSWKLSNYHTIICYEVFHSSCSPKCTCVPHTLSLSSTKQNSMEHSADISKQRQKPDTLLFS